MMIENWRIKSWSRKCRQKKLEKGKEVTQSHSKEVNANLNSTGKDEDPWLQSDIQAASCEQMTLRVSKYIQKDCY